MSANEEPLSMILCFVALASLSPATVYALILAAGADAPWPARLLQAAWRVAVPILTGFALTILFVTSLLSSVGAILVTGLSGYFILVLLGLWGIGSLAVMSTKKWRFVLPYLFAAIGLGYIFAADQIVLSLVAGDIGITPPLASTPIFTGYCVAVSMLLKGLLQDARDQLVRWLAAGACLSLIAGSLTIGPSVLLASDEGDTYRAVVASLVWTATALSVWSVGTAALLVAGRNGVVWGFLVASVAVYLAVLLAMIGAVGPTGPVVPALALLTINCAAAHHAWRLLSGSRGKDSTEAPIPNRLVEDWT